MRSFSIKEPIWVAASIVATLAIWSLVYIDYYEHIRAAQPRYMGVDLFLMGLALIGKLDKIGVPIAQLIFNEVAQHSKADLIAGGMLCGTPLGASGGAYFIAWNVERAFRGSRQHAGIKQTLHLISIVYLTVCIGALGLGSWYIASMSTFLMDVAIPVLAASFLSFFGVLSIYAVFGWVAFWSVKYGRRKWDSFNKFN